MKLYKEEKKTSSTNSADLTGYPQVEECKQIHIYHPPQKRPQHKHRYTKPNRKESRE